MSKGRPVFLVIALASAVVLAACASEGAGDEGQSETSGAPGAQQPDIGEIGGMCGGIAGFQCKAEGAYCRSEPGACRDTADYAGVCTQKPEICTMEYAPVCGCDGETYPSACAAVSKGVSVAYRGECEDAG